MTDAHFQSETADLIARECLASRMRRLNRVISSIYDRSFRPMGLTVSQLNILVVLARQGGAGSTGGTEGAMPADVCELLQMDKSTLSRNIQRMQRQGWVRTVKVEDARSHRLEVTAEGLGLIDQALPLWQQAQARAREVVEASVVAGEFSPADAPIQGKAHGVERVKLNTNNESKQSVVNDLDDYEASRSTPRDHRATGQGIFFWE